MLNGLAHINQTTAGWQKGFKLVGMDGWIVGLHVKIGISV
jgi:hypothetical protein